MENKLSAPVGDPKCKDPKPGNKPKDIATIELWLIAQGAPYKMTGKMNAGLVKMIRMYQGSKGKLSKNDINGVIQPGDKTWNAGAVKYFRYRDMIANFEAYEVVEKGKTKLIEVDEFIRLEIEARRKIISNAKAVQSEADVIEKLIRNVQETMAGQDGYLNAMVAIGMHGFGLSDPPSAKAALNARAAAGQVIAATDRSKVDWKKVKKLCAQTSKLHNKAVKEWKDYNNKYTKRAEWGAFGATVVSEGAFAVLEVLATGYLITTRGMDPKRAQVMAAVGCEGLKVSAGELGEYAANDKFDPKASTQKVLGNMMITGVAASLGASLSSKAYKGVVTKVSQAAARQFNTRMQKYTLKVVSAILGSGAGQNMMKGAIAEVGNLAKDAAAGKKIDEKRIVDALANSLIGGLAGCASFKSLKKFDSGWQKRSVDMAGTHFSRAMEKSLFVKMVAKHGDKFTKAELMEFASREGADVTIEAAKKLTELMGKTAYASIAEKMTGNESSVEAYEKLAVKGLQKDGAFISALEQKVLEEGEKRLKKLAKAG
ncbi:hypothetical protein [uncultured Tateyamaria sp.]|uniref:hypothetical protein n=1 Tax=uncultured Tateyamaria sp. TaxID=455651 RepID=UPI00261DB85D|nr:hypothetical protein [uncultured Tateyamaria sp.]